MALTKSVSNKLSRVLVNDIDVDTYINQTDPERLQKGANILLDMNLEDDNPALAHSLIEYAPVRDLIDMLNKDLCKEEFIDRYNEMMETASSCIADRDCELEEPWYLYTNNAYFYTEKFSDESFIEELEKRSYRRDIDDHLPDDKQYISDKYHFQGAIKRNSTFSRHPEDFKEYWDSLDEDCQLILKPVFMEEFEDSPQDWPLTLLEGNLDQALEKNLASTSLHVKLIEVFGEEKAQDIVYEKTQYKLDNKLLVKDSKFGPRDMGYAYGSNLSLKEYGRIFDFIREEQFDKIWDNYLDGRTTNSGISELSEMDNPPQAIKIEILKSKITKTYQSKTSNSQSWPSYDIDREIIESITDLQLIKFINQLSAMDVDNLEDIEDFDYYKQRMSRKILQGDDRAKEALGRIKEQFPSVDSEDEDEDGDDEPSISPIEKAKREAEEQLNGLIKNKDMSTIISEMRTWSGEEASKRAAASDFIQALAYKPNYDKVTLRLNRDEYYNMYQKLENAGFNFNS